MRQEGCQIRFYLQSQHGQNIQGVPQKITPCLLQPFKQGVIFCGTPCSNSVILTKSRQIQADSPEVIFGKGSDQETEVRSLDHIYIYL